MSNKTQLRLKSITGSFGSQSNDGIIDSHNQSPIADITVNNVSDILSHVASSIKRIHNGSEFSDMGVGEFNTSIIPSISEEYYLGNDSNKWLGLKMASGSLLSKSGELELKAEGGSQLIFSASLDSNTITHKFEGVGLELESLFNTQTEYAAVGKVEDVMYNVDGSLYFGTTLLNAPYNVIKEVVKLSGPISANSSLISNSSFAGVDLSNLPVSNRDSLVDVFFNGQLLMNGTSGEVASGDADYYIDVTSITSADFQFSFEMFADDVITIVSKYVETSAASADVFGQVSQDQRSEQLAAGEYSGEIVTFGSGTLVAGQIYALSSSGWVATDADDTSKGSDSLLAIAIGTSPADGMLIKGYYHPNTTLLPDHSPGKAVFISAVEGGYTTTAPSGAGQFARIVGHCTPDSNIIIFNPEQSWLELS